MDKKQTTVMDLPLGFFHYAKIKTGNSIEEVLEGEIIESEKQKQMWDLLLNIKYPFETEVIAFQKNEELEIDK